MGLMIKVMKYLFCFDRTKINNCNEWIKIVRYSFLISIRLKYNPFILNFIRFSAYNKCVKDFLKMQITETVFSIWLRYFCLD